MRKDTLLWIVQGVLALLFLFAGVMKLVLPPEALAAPVPLPGAFLRFIGVAEVLGGLGLILPSALKMWTVLAPVAAAGLMIIMTGATVVTVLGGSAAQAIVPVVVGTLLAVVIHGRSPRVLHRAVRLA